MSPETKEQEILASWGEQSMNRPVYCLPNDVVDDLHREYTSPSGKKTHPPFFSDETFQMESAFSSYCRENRFVGIYRNRFISYPLLPWGEPPELSDTVLATAASMEWDHNFPNDERMMHALRSADRQRSSARRKILGYVGWLHTCQKYLEEEADVVTLMQQAELLDCLPVKYSSFVTSGALPGEEALHIPDEVGEHLRRFMQRWYLMELTAPGLPLPQGPWFALMHHQEELVEKRPPDISLHVPPYFAVQEDDRVLNDLWMEQQRLGSRLLEVDRRDGPFPITEHKQFSAAFMAKHVYNAVRSRHECPRGSVHAGKVKRSIAVLLHHVGENHRDPYSASDGDEMKNAVRIVDRHLKLYDFGDTPDP